MTPGMSLRDPLQAHLPRPLSPSKKLSLREDIGFVLISLNRLCRPHCLHGETEIQRSAIAGKPHHLAANKANGLQRQALCPQQCSLIQSQCPLPGHPVCPCLLAVGLSEQTGLDAPWEQPQGASGRRVTSGKGDPGCAALSYLKEDVQGLLDVLNVFPG